MSRALTACGGGGGGAPPSSARSGGTGRTASVSLVSALVKEINATGLTCTNGYALVDPETFTLSSSGNYYYKLSFIGTAVTNALFNVNGSLTTTSGNSPISGSGFLGYDIGGRVSGTSSGSPLQIVWLYLAQPAALDPAATWLAAHISPTTLRDHHLTTDPFAELKKRS